MSNEKAITVRGEEELMLRAGHLFEGMNKEFVCAVTDLDTWAHPQARQAVKNRIPTAGRGGFTVNKLLTPRAITHEAGRLHLRRISARGAQVRISSTALPHETIIIDRRVVILAGQDSPAGREFTVTTSQALVGGVHALFAAAWDGATDLDTYLRGQVPHLDPADRLVLQALGSGWTDETAARRVGLPLRTYRRRVSDVMRKLGARSRFQAGLRAGELGHDRLARRHGGT